MRRQEKAVVVEFPTALQSPRPANRARPLERGAPIGLGLFSAQEMYRDFAKPIGTVEIKTLADLPQPLEKHLLLCGLLFHNGKPVVILWQRFDEIAAQGVRCFAALDTV